MSVDIVMASLLRLGLGAPPPLVAVVILSLGDPGPAHKCQHLNKQSHYVGILFVSKYLLFGA